MIRRAKNIIAVFLIIFMIVPCGAFSQEEPSGEPSGVDEGRAVASDKIPGGIEGFISLDLRDIDVVEALKFLSRRADLDIVTTKNATGRVTLMVENVLVRDVFDIMLRSNKLAYDKRGDIYNVMTEDEYKNLYGKPFSDTREVKTFRLKYIIPEQAFSLFDTLKSDIGRVLVDPESGSVLIVDVKERIMDMAKALDAFEEKNDVKIFQLQYAKAKDVEDQLSSQLDAKRVGLIKADERQNRVIVQTLPERMLEIERIIRELDGKTKEVIIDTTIVKIKLSDESTKGLEWEGLFDALKLKGDLFYVGSSPFATVNPVTTAGSFTSRRETLQEEGYVGSYPFSGTTSSLASSVPAVGSEELHVGLVGAQDFDAALKYIQSLGKSKILANPKLVTTNNQESRIHVGEKQAYVTTTTTTGQVTSTVAEDVTFVDVGTQFSVTPEINSDGYVTMKVKVEISSVSSTLTTPTQNKIPIIDTSLAETTVMVKEGTTVIIGGLRKDERSGSTKQTPILGSIPLLGYIFKTDTNKVEHFELVIMLTPRIITGDVFVSRGGHKIEHVGVKGVQNYNELRPVSKIGGLRGIKGPEINNAGLVVDEVGMPPVSPVVFDDKKVMFKGLRVTE